MRPQIVLRDLVHHLVNEIVRDPSVAPRFERHSSAQAVWSSLLFCILSSQVKAESAAIAVEQILEQVPFFSARLSSVDVYHNVKHALCSGTKRYRFPDARSKQIASSWFSFAQIQDEFYEYLDSFEDEQIARSTIAEQFPGLGLKQSSMFLRDIGYSNRLCVIDTHIMWYCNQMNVRSSSALTARRYLELEDYMLESSDFLGVPPNIFDSAVWVAVKAFKSRQCTMLSA